MPIVYENVAEQPRKILHRTQGLRNGPLVRLMSPSDLGQMLKPFVFLDFVDMTGPPFAGQLHPHSGIATLSYLIDGRADLIDPEGKTVVLEAGGVEWMHAGRGMWHGGSAGDEAHGRVRGFQLWVALPPEHELGPTTSVFQSTLDIAISGPARVLLGSYGNVHSAINAPSPMNVLAVKLKAAECWTYVPPFGHTVLWVSAAEGQMLADGEQLRAAELVAFEHSTKAVEFEAMTDVHFVIGSAAPHDHHLYLGYYSVHTSAAALRSGEEHIQAIGRRLVDDGRLQARQP